MTPRLLLLSGGNAAGKTTALRHLQAHYASVPGWAWVYPDHDPGDLKAKKDLAFKALMRLWNDRSLVGIAMEGTRIYSRVFECLLYSAYPREFYAAIIGQQPDIVRTHVRERCERAGKTYNTKYWEGRSGAYEGARRHPSAFKKWLAEYPELIPRVHTQEFWIGLDYSGWDAVFTWTHPIIVPPHQNGAHA